MRFCILFVVMLSACSEQTDIGQAQKSTKAILHSLEETLKLYMAEHDLKEFPDSLDVLTKEHLVNGKTARQIIDSYPKDFWGNRLHYRRPKRAGGRPLIWSSGSNGIDEGGGGDDITNQ